MPPLLGGVLGVLYVVLAGIKEVGWINVLNAILMYVSVILAMLFLAFKLPGGDFSSVAEFYTASDDEHMLTIFGPPELLWTFAFGLVVALVFSQPANQPLLQICMAAKSEKTIIRALWIAAPVNGLFGVFICVIGLTAKSLPEFQVLGPKIAATTMLLNLLPDWLVIFLIGSFMAAILSSFAMTALAPATIFSNDIYKRFYNPQATEAQIASVTRGGHRLAGNSGNCGGIYTAHDSAFCRMGSRVVNAGVVADGVWPFLETNDRRCIYNTPDGLVYQYPVVIYAFTGLAEYDKHT